MSDSTTKPCRRCREPIAAGAQRCPKCQSWQGALAYLLANRCAVISILFGFVPLLFLFWLFWPGADFAKYQDQIQVLEPKITVNDDDKYAGVVTVGRLENRSPLKWNDIVIEVQYFDVAGKLITAKSDRSHDMVLLPSTQHAFSISSTRENP